MRNHWLDAARGAALVPMVVFHFAWDLALFGLIATDIARDPAWMWLARLTAGSFLLLSGASAMLAVRAGVAPRARRRRIGAIAAAAALVSVGSFIYLPQGWIFFGILHAIVVCGLLAWPLARAPGWLLGALAAAAFALPFWAASDIFNAPIFWWLGLSTRVPASADFIPILPWIAPFLVGMLLGRALPLSTSAAPRFLTWPGQHTLPIYLLHQPILIGALMAASPLLTPPRATLESHFVAAHNADCRGAGEPAQVCAAYASCAVERLAPLLAAAHHKRLSPAEQTRWQEALDACSETAIRLR